MQRFTFVYEKLVTSQISSYDRPFGLQQQAADLLRLQPGHRLGAEPQPLVALGAVVGPGALVGLTRQRIVVGHRAAARLAHGERFVLDVTVWRKSRPGEPDASRYGVRCSWKL
jgi:hypothetical protein